MTDSWALIIATIITVVGGGIGWLIKEILNFRKENRDDHAVVMNEIKGMKKGIDRLTTRFDSHIDWHMKNRK